MKENDKIITKKKKKKELLNRPFNVQFPNVF